MSAPPAPAAPLDDPNRSAAPLGVPTVVWMLAGSALLLRLAMILLRGSFDPDVAGPTAIEHASLAVSLLAGHGFAFGDWGHYGPSSIQSPPYPLLLAALYWIFDVGDRLDPAAWKAYLSAQTINAFAAAATVLLAYAMVLRLRGTHAVGVVTAALLAVWPTQLYHVEFVQAITLITLATVAVVVLWYVSIDTGRLGPWVAYGVVGCVGALTEPVLLPAMAISGVIILLHPRLSTPLRLRNGAILLTCAIVIIGPWTWRNYVVHDTFMPIKSTFWVNVWKGNNPNSVGTDRPALSPARLQAFREEGRDDVRQYDLLTPEQRADLQGRPDAVLEQTFKQYTTEFIRENPGRYLELCGLRLAKTLWWEWDNPRGHQMLYAYPVSRAVLLLGSIVGLVLAVRQRWRLGLPALIFGTSVLTYTLTITAARFTMPLEPFQIALTALALVWAWQKVRPQRERPPVVQAFTRRNDGQAPATA